MMKGIKAEYKETENTKKIVQFSRKYWTEHFWGGSGPVDDWPRGLDPALNFSLIWSFLAGSSFTRFIVNQICKMLFLLGESKTLAPGFWSNVFGQFLLQSSSFKRFLLARSSAPLQLWKICCSALVLCSGGSEKVCSDTTYPAPLRTSAYNIYL